MFCNDLFRRDVSYYSIRVLHNDTLVMQGFFLKHAFLGQLQAFVYLSL